MQKSRTTFLLLITLLTAGAACVAGIRLDRARSAALATEADLSAVQHDLADITQANAGGPLIAIGQLDAAELARHLTAAGGGRKSFRASGRY